MKKSSIFLMLFFFFLCGTLLYFAAAYYGDEEPVHVASNLPSAKSSVKYAKDYTVEKTKDLKEKAKQGFDASKMGHGTKSLDGKVLNTDEMKKKIEHEAGMLKNEASQKIENMGKSNADMLKKKTADMMDSNTDMLKKNTADTVQVNKDMLKKKTADMMDSNTNMLKKKAENTLDGMKNSGKETVAALKNKAAGLIDTMKTKEDANLEQLKKKAEGEIQKVQKSLKNDGSSMNHAKEQVQDSSHKSVAHAKSKLVRSSAPSMMKGWIGSSCKSSGQCGYRKSMCLNSGTTSFCSASCTHLCPDRRGQTETFCVSLKGVGRCVLHCNYKRYPETGCRNGFRCEQKARFGTSTKMKRVCLPM